jgi:hypothetical protein
MLSDRGEEWGVERGILGLMVVHLRILVLAYHHKQSQSRVF